MSAVHVDYNCRQDSPLVAGQQPNFRSRRAELLTRIPLIYTNYPAPRTSAEGNQGLQSSRPLNSALSAFSAVKNSASSVSLRANSCNSCKAFPVFAFSAVKPSVRAISLSLTPCFSWVQQCPQLPQPFQRFPHAVETRVTRTSSQHSTLLTNN